MELSEYQKDIVNAFNNTDDNLFINAYAGCVDCDTEYFNGTEWKRIADYKQGDKVLQYNPDDKQATLVQPLKYIKVECNKLYHFYSTDIDQCLSLEHRILYYKSINNQIEIKEMTVGEYLKNPQSFFIPSSFYYNDMNVNVLKKDLCIQTYFNLNDINIKEYKTTDGYKYCFTMPLGTLVLRRNNKIFITGNSGKSFMLLELSKYINSYSVFIAFNKNIQEELKTKINNPKFKAYTFNGLGYQIMRYNWEEEQKKIAKKNPEYQVQELTVDPFKSNELSSLVCSEKKDILDFELISIKDSDDENLEEDVYVSFVNDLSHLFDLCRQRMVNFSDETKVFETIEFYELFSDIIEIPSNIMDLLNKMLVLDIEWANEGKIDFIDQLYITYFKVFQKQWKVPFWNQFENIFIDETQDLSRLQQLFISLIKRSKGRVIAVGDVHQCQPEGTKILMRDGTEKNIEEVNIGESIAQYDKRHGLIVGVSNKKDINNNYCISDKKEFKVNKLVSVKLDNGYSSKYTYNHICFAKMNPITTKNAYCLYLMYKEDENIFRIGKVKLYNKSFKSLLLRHRTIQEGFDKAWILNIYDTNKEVWINEQLYSLKYQIPQLIFQDEKSTYDRDDINYVYNNIGGNMFDRAMMLLDEFNKNFDFPFFERGETYTHISKEHGFFVAACNLFPKYMDMGIYNENNIRYHTHKKRKPSFRGRFIEYHNIEQRDFLRGDFKVYGITVPYMNMYVADKIVTHNSVYSFAGADCHSVDTLKRLYNLKEFNLPINYRCPQKHLRYVNRKYDIPIQARPDAPEGILQTIEYKNLPYFVEKGDCIISRKNADLCKTALKLLECNKAVYIRDEKLVDRLITKIFSFKNVINSLSEMDEHIKKLKREQHAAIEKRTEKLIEKGVVDNEQVENTTFSDSSIDLLDCLQVLLENYRNKPNSLDDFSSFINYVRQMLNTKERRGAIELTSIHQAKGKEWDRVFVLNNARIFREYAKTSDQLQQETNLSYVAVTRSKDTLYLVEETVEKKDEESPEDSNFENYDEYFDE